MDTAVGKIFTIVACCDKSDIVAIQQLASDIVAIVTLVTAVGWEGCIVGTYNPFLFNVFGIGCMGVLYKTIHSGFHLRHCFHTSVYYKHANVMSKCVLRRAEPLTICSGWDRTHTNTTRSYGIGLYVCTISCTTTWHIIHRLCHMILGHASCYTAVTTSVAS